MAGRNLRRTSSVPTTDEVPRHRRTVEGEEASNEAFSTEASNHRRSPKEVQDPVKNPRTDSSRQTGTWKGPLPVEDSHQAALKQDEALQPKYRSNFFGCNFLTFFSSFSFAGKEEKHFWDDNELWNRILVKLQNFR